MKRLKKETWSVRVMIVAILAMIVLGVGVGTAAASLCERIAARKS